VKKKSMNVFIVVLIVFLGYLFLMKPSSTEYPVNYEYKNPDGIIYNFNYTSTGVDDYHVLIYTYLGSENDWFHRKSAIPFEYSPMDLEDLESPDLRSRLLNASAVYLTGEPDLEYKTNGESTIAMLTLVRILDPAISPQIFNVPTGIVYTSHVEGSSVVTCENATSDIVVIELNKGYRNRIVEDGNCIKVSFTTGQNSLKLFTRMTYNVLGVM